MDRFDSTENLRTGGKQPGNAFNRKRRFNMPGTLPIGIAVLLLGVGALVVGQERKGQPDGQEAKTGTIQGKIDSPWIKRSAAVVYLKDVPGKFPPPSQQPVMDQRGLKFIPHVLPVLVGSTVSFPNNDSVRHNVFSPSRSARRFNLGIYPAGATKHVTYDRVGVVPLLCNVHSEMSAFVVVLPNPYFAVTDDQGSFKIENIPEGTYTLTFWHGKLRPKAGKVPVRPGKNVRVTFRGLKRARRYSVDL